MANNVAVKDATGTTLMMETEETSPSSGIHRSVHKVAELPNEPLGASADVAVEGDTGGTVSAKLRGINKILHTRLPSAIGQRTAADSLSFVLASDAAAFSFSIGASENFIGFIGRTLVTKNVSPTITATPYAIGACLGGKQTLTNMARIAAGAGEILAGLLMDKAQLGATIDLLLFDADPTSSTFTDTIAAVLHANDLTKLVGVIRFSNLTVQGGVATGHVNKILPFKIPSGTTMYAALVTQTGITPVSTSDIVVRLSVRQD